jgi:hypothetical protein
VHFGIEFYHHSRSYLETVKFLLPRSYNFNRMRASDLLVLFLAIAFVVSIKAGTNMTELHERSAFAPNALQFDYPEVSATCRFRSLNYHYENLKISDK